MHNQPIQPLSDLETLREENERLREELTAHIHSEASLYSAASCLLGYSAYRVGFTPFKTVELTWDVIQSDNYPSSRS